MKSIADHIRPDRQCLVFSATCKTKIEKLIMHALYDPIKILCGDVGEANADVQQTIIVLDDLNAKFNWLFSNIVRLITSNCYLEKSFFFYNFYFFSGKSAYLCDKGEFIMLRINSLQFFYRKWKLRMWQRN